MERFFDPLFEIGEILVTHFFRTEVTVFRLKNVHCGRLSGTPDTRVRCDVKSSGAGRSMDCSRWSAGVFGGFAFPVGVSCFGSTKGFAKRLRPARPFHFASSPRGCFQVLSCVFCRAPLFRVSFQELHTRVMRLGQPRLCRADTDPIQSPAMRTPIQ